MLPFASCWQTEGRKMTMATTEQMATEDEQNWGGGGRRGKKVVFKYFFKLLGFLVLKTFKTTFSVQQHSLVI